MGRTGDRTVQVDRSKADNASDRQGIYGVCQEDWTWWAGVQGPVESCPVQRPKDRDGRGGNNYLPSLLSKSSCDCWARAHVLYPSGEQLIIESCHLIWHGRTCFVRQWGVSPLDRRTREDWSASVGSDARIAWSERHHGVVSRHINE